MNIYYLMLQGGQESSLSIEAWDMGHAIRIAKEKINEGWDVCKIRCQDGYESLANTFM